MSGFSSAYNSAFGPNTTVEDTTQTTTSKHEPILEYYLLTVAEIIEVTDTTNILIWDDDSYNTGKVWG